MPLRVTGLNSGLDTESIITALVEAKSATKNKLIKEQTKLEWKQDAWKELNSKVYSFYTKTLSNMRMQSDYMKKTTKVSNEDVATVITGANAVNGLQTLKVTSLAKTGYLTGAELKSSTGETVTGSTKLSDLNPSLASRKLTVEINGDKKDITLDGNMTISKLSTELQKAGLNANFDEANGRFFISSKTSGAAGDFTITSDNSAALQSLGLDTNNGATKIDGKDATIELNGATFKSTTNTFSINGLTITANQESSEEITLNTTEDTDGVYDMIKNFFKEYNALIIEMDSLYNADSAKGYEPLTDDEKEAMSEKEIEKWEEKIKDAILRNDSTLSTVTNSMKQIMLEGVTMSDGSKMYLSDFGINTLGYFESEANEKGAYHIDGDADDASTSLKEDKLRAAIATNPDQVTEFFSSLTKNLYNKLQGLMARTEYSSAFTLYDDKLMKTEYDDYKTKISRQEELIKNYEDRYYEKFAAMETALAGINSKQNALSGLFGS